MLSHPHQHFIMRAHLTIFLAAALLAVVAAQSDTNTIAQNLAALSGGANGKNYRTETLAKLVKDQNLEATLGGAQPLTLFAPTDAAFKALADVPSDKAILGDLLSLHLVTGPIYAENLAAFQIVQTQLRRIGSPYVAFSPTSARGQALAVAKNGNDVTVAVGSAGVKAKVVDSLKSGNSIIHVIDQVLLPAKGFTDTLGDAKFTQFAALLKKAKLDATVDKQGDTTGFIPTDAAMDKVKDALAKLSDSQLKALVSTHISPGVIAYSAGLQSRSVPTIHGHDLAVQVDGDKITVEKNINIISKDIFTNNGVLFGIDFVVFPDQIASVNNGTSNTGAAPNTTTTAKAGPAGTSAATATNAAAAVVLAAVGAIALML
ncbi:hypothetical protein H9P43_007129 [Blastocladiella emersonii ATCC 22665]|nr:hypothetical protein H9P43_007129 [Blastocladiella emersonii ATCC 22665]